MSQPEKANEFPAKSRRIAPLMIAQLLIVGVAIAGVSYRAVQMQHQRDLPPLRDLPLEIGPVYDDPTLISDDDLKKILLKLRPKFEGAKTTASTGPFEHDEDRAGAPFNPPPARPHRHET